MMFVTPFAPVLTPYSYDKPGVYNPPIAAYYHEIPITVQTDLIKHVIGANGKYFNAITKASGVFYIWFRKERNIIEVWGPSVPSMDSAVKRIFDRMELIKQRFSISQIQPIKQRFSISQEEIEWKAICDTFSTKNIGSWADDEDLQ